MNCAVLAWDTALGDEAPVTLHMIQDWSRIESAFTFHESVRENIIERLSAITTFAHYRRMCDRMGPYTPFEFTEERGSIVSPNETASDMAAHFLRLKV